MMNRRTIIFDLDGTLYNLYKIPDWLPRLREEDSTVFGEEMPRYNYKRINQAIAVLIAQGWNVGVITWAPMGCTRGSQFFQEVEDVKFGWLMDFFPALENAHFACLPYGESKSQFMRDMEEEGDINYLVDDNKDVRREWRSKGSTFKTINASRSFVRELEGLAG